VEGVNQNSNGCVDGLMDGSIDQKTKDGWGMDGRQQGVRSRFDEKNGCNAVHVQNDVDPKRVYAMHLVLMFNENAWSLQTGEKRQEESDAVNC
jgi:hypothetical protein